MRGAGETLLQIQCTRPLATHVPWASCATVSPALQLVFAAYLYLMLRRAHGVSAWYGAAVALALAWSSFFIVWLLRYFPFEVTLGVI